MLKTSWASNPRIKTNFGNKSASCLNKKLETSTDEKSTNDLALVIFEQATLAEGLQLDDPVGFVNRINQLFNNITIELTFLIIRPVSQLPVLFIFRKVKTI